MAEQNLEQAVLVLDRNEVARLKRPVRGTGGFQSLYRRIGKHVKGKRLILTTEIASDIVRYVERYGPGGFQSRLAPRIVEAARMLLLRQQLLEKSVEAFILALETINRLSIKYRVENFAFLICNAWELLMKAKLLLDVPERKSVYYPAKPDEPVRSLALGDCCGRLMTNTEDPVRRNLELVEDLRDEAVHLVISQVPKEVLGIFQSCVLNYHRKLGEWFGVSLSDRVSVGMMTIVYDFRPEDFDVSSVTMKSRLGEETAKYLMGLQARIGKERGDLGSPHEYIIDLNYHLAFVKNPNKADVNLSHGAGGASAYAIEVPSDPGKTHPFEHRDIVKAISDLTDGKVKVGVYDMRCVIAAHKWSSGDSFYYRSSVGNRNQYSEAAINWLKKQVKKNPSFFQECREQVRQRGLLDKG